jgi:RNA polymerase sigma factor (sigma-70 family)
MRKFGVPAGDAEALLQEALLALLTTDAVISHAKAWLVATMCNGSRSYWRQRARTDRVEGATLPLEMVDDDHEVERLERQLLVQAVLSLLPAADRSLLRLHYFEELTAAVIGEQLGMMKRYAEKRISKALRRARDVYTALHARVISVDNLKSG